MVLVEAGRVARIMLHLLVEQLASRGMLQIKLISDGLWLGKTQACRIDEGSPLVAQGIVSAVVPTGRHGKQLL